MRVSEGRDHFGGAVRSMPNELTYARSQGAAKPWRHIKHAHNPDGYAMIRSIEIQNFRCFEQVRIDDCRRINVIVGDNGAGKTSLLEALFWALGTTSELAVRYRQQRGFEQAFNAPTRQIEEAIWRDFFYRRNWNRPIVVETKGEGAESRSVVISRGTSQLSIPLSEGGDRGESLAGSVVVTWKDSKQVDYVVRPRIARGAIEFPGTEEDLPDWFYFAASHFPSSTENAGRFSELSRARRVLEFTKVFTSEYDWIEDLSIEVTAGAPIIYATLKGLQDKVPLPNVSGGINRITSVMLGIASRSRAVVLVDEMENGVYHTHHAALWKAILSLSRNYQTQLFVTTHSEEWLTAMASATDVAVDDIAVWRLERNVGAQPTIYQFSGEKLIEGIRHGADVRGTDK